MKYFCPVNGWDCPYWSEDQECTISNPMEECEDYHRMNCSDEEYLERYDNQV